MPAAPPPNPVAYCNAVLDANPLGGTLKIVVYGCVMNADGTLMAMDPSTPGADQFNVTVPLSYGDGNAELTAKVMTALQATYGVTGLADVKFIPAL